MLPYANLVSAKETVRSVMPGMTEGRGVVKSHPHTQQISSFAHPCTPATYFWNSDLAIQIRPPPRIGPFYEELRFFWTSFLLLQITHPPPAMI